MFAKSARGLLDALGAALCLWVAAYQTPLGALARATGGSLFRVHTSVRPLLAYYSAGVYDEASESTSPRLLAPLPGVPAAVPASEALAYGVQSALGSADPAAWPRVAAMATARSIPSAGMAEGKGAPLALSRLIRALTAELGSPEVAVVAIFCGEEVARFARDRAQAAGRAPDVQALARALPPSQTEGVALASRAVMLGEAFALRWPVADDTRITSPFGLRTHPILGTQQLHTGVDLSVPTGTPVHATGVGVVRRASEDALNGKVIIIDHGRGVTTAYCHNSELLVSVGDRIELGQVIAHSGTTGRSTGPHVHYQLEFGGKPTDPLAFHRATLESGAGSAMTD